MRRPLEAAAARDPGDQPEERGRTAWVVARRGMEDEQDNLVTWQTGPIAQFPGGDVRPQEPDHQAMSRLVQATTGNVIPPEDLHKVAVSPDPAGAW